MNRSGHENSPARVTTIDTPISIEESAFFLLTFGFMHEANLGERATWPTAFALKKLDRRRTGQDRRSGEESRELRTG
jgi:hypothetical protein